jgi:hypothetical protein
MILQFLAYGLTSAVFSYMEELQRPAHAGVRNPDIDSESWNEDHGEVK